MSAIEMVPVCSRAWDVKLLAFCDNDLVTANSYIADHFRLHHLLS